MDLTGHTVGDSTSFPVYQSHVGSPICADRNDCTSVLLLLNNYKNLPVTETKNPVTAEIIAVTGL